MIRAGLRTRVVAGFTAGALTLSATMAFVSYEITRRSLLAARENTAVRAAYYDASVVGAGIATAVRPDIVAVLRSLDTGEDRRALLHRDGQWYARSADSGVTGSVPIDSSVSTAIFVTASASARSAPACRTAQVTARYMAPVSR